MLGLLSVVQNFQEYRIIMCIKSVSAFFNKGQSLPLFRLFSSFSHFNYNFNNTNWKKCRWCARVSNRGCRPNHGAKSVIVLTFEFKIHFDCQVPTTTSFATMGSGATTFATWLAFSRVWTLAFTTLSSVSRRCWATSFSSIRTSSTLAATPFASFPGIFSRKDLPIRLGFFCISIWTSQDLKALNRS